jgi:hypothetical protein
VRALGAGAVVGPPVLLVPLTVRNSCSRLSAAHRRSQLHLGTRCRQPVSPEHRNRWRVGSRRCASARRMGPPEVHRRVIRAPSSVCCAHLRTHHAVRPRHSPGSAALFPCRTYLMRRALVTRQALYLPGAPSSLAS